MTKGEKMDKKLVPVSVARGLLSRAEFQKLAAVPPEA